MELESVYKVIHLIENQYNKDILVAEIERVSYRNIQRVLNMLVVKPLEKTKKN